MYIEKLKKRALELVDIPERFHLVIENKTQEERDLVKVIFVWSTEDEEEHIEVVLSQDGHLYELKVDLKDEITGEISKEEQKRKAEAFLLEHYPNALEHFSFSKEKKQDNHSTRFSYEQFVLNLPLSLAGCYIVVNTAGDIIHFNYYGVKPTPKLPKELVKKEALYEVLNEQLKFQPMFKEMDKDSYDVEQSGIKLVYEVRNIRFDADDLEPMIEKEEGLLPESYVSLDEPNNREVKLKSLEELIGITETMEVIREVDLGNEIGRVWRVRDWQDESTDLSLSSFFHKRNDETVKAFIDKETGELIKFMSFKVNEGKLQLSREECLEKALQLLQQLIPDYHLLLELHVPDSIQDHDEQVMEEEKDQVEPFTFRLKNALKYPIESDNILLSVNNTTGEIICYLGMSSIRLKQLVSEMKVSSIISSEEVKKRYLEELDFKLAWELDYESEEEIQKLVYSPIVKGTKKQCRYIDAETGSLICWKY